MRFWTGMLVFAALMLGYLACGCSAATESPSPYGPWVEGVEPGTIVGHCVIDGIGYGCSSSLGPYMVIAPESLPATCDTVPGTCPVGDTCSIEGVGEGRCER